ncbi:tRNA (adenine(22)-N(1))-methyltransferase [Savagea faecisuis]|uniref:tRNA (Adenine(22)-N(1))-methyltransferase n=1 Tax=Savagea faecisuis TaxID=1274803 RepID=A0ABW3H2V3_9BACL
MMELSKRLQYVASYVPEGVRLADIGSDHAYLPCYLMERGQIEHAVAGEVVKGPFESAERNVREHGFSDKIDVRLANGLQAIHEEDAIHTVTIAGMGGPLIAQILESGEKHLATVERIIAQPNIHARPIREWAVSNNWKLIDEAIMKEDGKIYEILVLERGEATYSEDELQFGPYLMREQSEVFIEKWQREAEAKRNILQALQKAQKTEDNARRSEKIKQELTNIEGVIAK